MTLFVAYVCPNEFFIRHMGTVYLCRCKYFCFTDQFQNAMNFHRFEFSTGMISLLILFINMLCLLLVVKYYKGLKMLKRLTEEVVIPIPYRTVSNTFSCSFLVTSNQLTQIMLWVLQVPFHFRKENMYVGTGGYKHLLSDTIPESNPNYVV